jgi:hypothetical protein
MGWLGEVVSAFTCCHCIEPVELLSLAAVTPKILSNAG